MSVGHASETSLFGMNTLDQQVLDTAGKTLWQLVCERAEATPHKQMAFDEQGRTLTFGEYRAWAERVAAGLLALGVGLDSRVSWILPSRFESMVLAAALSRLGAIQNPILPIYRSREVGFITRQSGCSLLIIPGCIFASGVYTWWRRR